MYCLIYDLCITLLLPGTLGEYLVPGSYEGKSASMGADFSLGLPLHVMYPLSMMNETQKKECTMPALRLQHQHWFDGVDVDSAEAVAVCHDRLRSSDESLSWPRGDPTAEQWRIFVSVSTQMGILRGFLHAANGMTINSHVTTQLDIADSHSLPRAPPFLHIIPCLLSSASNPCLHPPPPPHHRRCLPSAN